MSKSISPTRPEEAGFFTSSLLAPCQKLEPNELTLAEIKISHVCKLNLTKRERGNNFMGIGDHGGGENLRWCDERNGN
ncbi:unnamed protein product [Linum trigynum]|uniref:Uncharacterized protein n=1 Tax=Linum trigynum TaxID=586398 RepID=A0AAV2GUE5_9ROSI